MRRRGNIKQLMQPSYNPCAFLTGLLGWETTAFSYRCKQFS